MADSFTITQKAFIVNHKNEVLLLKNGDFWDFPGGQLKDSDDLRNNLVRTISELTGLHITTVSIPLNLRVTKEQSEHHIIRIIYLCRAEGTVSLTNPQSEYVWTSTLNHSQYHFPDSGFDTAFRNFLINSQISSLEFLSPPTNP